MIRWSIILAAIPLVTLGGGWAMRPAAPVRVVEAEGIRAQRPDTDTFRYRYAPTADMPLTVETKLEPLLLVTHDPPAISAMRTVRTVRTQTYSICTRHGMRKVMVGRYKWRCRR